jgi:hypothetical protein
MSEPINPQVVIDFLENLEFEERRAKVKKSVTRVGNPVDLGCLQNISDQTTHLFNASYQNIESKIFVYKCDKPTSEEQDRIIHLLSLYPTLKSTTIFPLLASFFDENQLWFICPCSFSQKPLLNFLTHKWPEDETLFIVEQVILQKLELIV